VGALPFDDWLRGELVVPAVVVARDGDGRAWITETAPAGELFKMASGPGGGAHASGNGTRRPATALRPLPHPSDNGAFRLGVPIRERPGRGEWTAAVRRVLAAIAAGDVRKVVLAREVVLQAAAPFCRQEVLDRLRQCNPSSFVYGAGGFVGASPELLIRRRGEEMESCPMAGTVARGATPEEDDRLAVGLSASAKDGEEHRLLVEGCPPRPRTARSTACWWRRSSRPWRRSVTACRRRPRRRSSGWPPCRT
jgi:isochorismate synthase EntC